MNWDSEIQSGCDALEQGDWTAAEEHLKSALKSAKKTFFHNDPRIAQTLALLGECMFGAGRLDEAEPLLKQAANLMENGSDGGAWHGRSLLFLSQIARRKKNKTALKQYNRAIAELRKSASDADIAVLESRAGSSNTKIATSQRASAPTAGAVTESTEKAQAELEVIPSSMPDMPVDVEAAKEKSVVDLKASLKLLESANAEDAITAYISLRDNLAIAYLVYGQEHPHIAQLINGLALAAATAGAYDHAETLYKSALRVISKTLRHDSLDAAFITLNLATLYANTGKYELANDHFQDAVRVFDVDPNVDPSWLAETIDAFQFVVTSWDKSEFVDRIFMEAALFEERGDLEAAIQTLDFAFKTYQEAPIPRDEKFALIFQMQAGLLRKAGDEANASVLEKAAHDIMQKRASDAESKAEVIKRLPPLPEP